MVSPGAERGQATLERHATHSAVASVSAEGSSFFSTVIHCCKFVAHARSEISVAMDGLRVSVSRSHVAGLKDTSKYFITLLGLPPLGVTHYPSLTWNPEIQATSPSNHSLDD